MISIAGARRPSQELLGAARNEIARRLELIEPGSWSFLFVVDFPMFEETEDGSWTFMHHPFTSPTPEWRETFADDKGANALANRLKKAGHPAFTEPVTTSRGTLWRVRVGPYATRDEANTARDRLKREGQNGIVATRS